MMAIIEENASKVFEHENIEATNRLDQVHELVKNMNNDGENSYMENMVYRDYTFTRNLLL